MSVSYTHLDVYKRQVYGLATGVKAFTKEGDAILIQQPVYYPFREVIEDNGRIFINNQLHYENGRYTVDFEDFERKIEENNVKVFLQMCIRDRVLPEMVISVKVPQM